jgi:alpha-mannosidase
MHYRWVQRANPQMFGEIRERVRQGRWEVVGGWPVEPDCNIPAAESFVRHSLYGKQFCRQALGADVKIGFNPDSFGHSAGLPIILQNAGYDAYVFMRPQEHEMNLPLLFWWEGAGGCRVLALRIFKEYDGKAENIRSAVDRSFAPGMDHGAFFLGVGDHGGAVTAEQVREVVAMQKDPSLPELRWSTLRDFFAAVRASTAFASLPVVHSELQHHSRGCYSAYGEGKYQNRRAERWMVESESITLLANLAADHPYPADEFVEAWWKVLFCQFHDMLAGTSLYPDYQDVRDSLGFACEIAQTRKVEALETMAQQVDTSKVKQSAFFLFNPLPWTRKALVEVYAEKNPEGAAGPITHLSDENGTLFPIQWRPPESMTQNVPRLATWVELPPCGYKVFELEHGKAPDGEAYSNAFAVSQTGFGLSSFKAEDGVELLAGSVGLVALSDTADTWAHDVKQFRQEMGRPTLLAASVVEDGPVTRVTRHRASWMNSEIILDIAQYAGIDAVEFRFVIHWHEHQQMLKLEIPTALAQPRIFAQVPGEVLERLTNGEEEPYQDWAAVQGRIGNQDYTVALLNAQTYSYDCLNGLFRTVLIRSAPFARHQPWPVTYNDTNAWQDQGRQERRFWLVGGQGPYTKFNLDRRSEEFQTPAEYVMDSAHPGQKARQQSFLEILPGNVWVLAVKRAEGLPGGNGKDGTILRLQERSGNATTTSLKSAALGLDHTVTLKPWELKTFLVKGSPRGRAELKEVSLLES